MLRAGIIGTGVISNLNALGYIYSEDAKIVAVADTNTDSAKKKLERWGTRTANVYGDYKEMVSREDLDIVEILTPHHLHAPMVEYCAKAGVPGICVQKPMAHTITDCDRIIKVCKEEGVKLKSFENFRFYPPYIKAKELLDQGIIGERLNFRINTIGTGGPGMPLSLLKSYLWRIQVEKCGGGPWVYDDGIHKFSMALWLMDQERVEEVHAWIDFFSGIMDGPDHIFFKYPKQNPDDPDENPKYGTMEFSLSANLYYPSNYYECDEFIEITGTKGIMWINQCTSGGNFVSETPQFPPIVVYKEGEVQTYGKNIARDWRHSFINSTMNFIEVMKNDGTPVYTGKQGKNLCIFAKMPYISSQRKTNVTWDEITAEKEAKGSCLVEPFFKKRKAFFRAIKFLWRQRKDMRRGIKQGLRHEKLKYEYNL
ncbi:MAG: Gfo/Idh/MocA family protein [Promethearchaeia archaeon]